MKRSAGRQVAAYGLTLVALGFTVLLAVRGADAHDPPSGREAAALAGFVALFQLAAAYLLASVGRADPSLARSAVRRLGRVAVRANKAEKLAQDAFESGRRDEWRTIAGTVSTALSYIQEDALDAIDDWREFHRDAIDQGGQESEGNHGGDRS